jgi:leucyl aminopeptidase
MIFTQNTSINPKLDLIIPFRKDKINQEQIHFLTKIRNPDFEGDFSEIQLLYGENGQRIYLLGLGSEKHAPKLSEAFRSLFFKHNNYWSENIQLDCHDLNEKEITLAVLGFEMGAYKIGAYKSKEEPAASKNQCNVILVSKEDRSIDINEGMFTGETINSIKTLVDAPPNYKTPKHLSEWALQSAREYGYDCKVLDQNDLEREGLQALLAVGQGSIHESRLIINSYLPNKGEKIDLGLVGKGITFDSGGLSIKPSTNLHYMKSDMGGAAAVLGAVELAAKLKLNINVIGIIASAENAVDADSFRPGDVIGSYSGKSIEIIDTDAEGRLVLADALSYMIRQYQPEHLIDLATLTGSVVRTLGFSAAGMFTNNKEIARHLIQIGTDIHERVWSLPLFDDFEEELHSDIADIRNFSGKPIAGAITAAKFLEAFTESHDKWVHLDIAGVAFGSNAYAKMKSASGFGVRLLTDFMKSFN